MQFRVAIRGEVRLSASSLAALLEVISGRESLRELAVDPRERLVTALAQVGYRAAFDGVRLQITADPDTVPVWSEAADHLVALVAHHADAGSLDAEANGEVVHLDAGRALAPVVAADLPWLEAVPSEGAGGGRIIDLGSTPLVETKVAMPEWIRASATNAERQFTLISPVDRPTTLPANFAAVDVPGGVEAVVGSFPVGEMFLAWRPLGGDPRVAEASKAIIARSIALEHGGADELVAALDAASMIVGIIVSSDTTYDDERLGFMEAVAIELGATVMDGMGRLIRQS